MPYKRTIPRVCEQCNKPFLTSQQKVDKGNGRYCSHRCWRDGVRAERRTQEDFMGRVEVLASGCWRWDRYIGKRGYGVCRDAGKNRGAHQVAYELFVGPVPEGLELDHLCRNRWCCNPDHLEAVPHRINAIRGMAPPMVVYRSGRCGRGHEWTEENTYVQPKTGKRQCRECRRIRREADSQRGNERTGMDAGSD